MMGSLRQDAMNLNQLAEAVTPLIPEDWKVEITLVKDEISIDLYDPGGNRFDDWETELTTNETVLWYVNQARRIEGLPPGKVQGLRSLNEFGVFEDWYEDGESEADHA